MTTGHVKAIAPAMIILELLPSITENNASRNL